MFHQLCNFYYKASQLHQTLSSLFSGSIQMIYVCLWCCCLWMVSSFLVFLPSFCSSSWCQFIIPTPYLSTGTANDPIAWILLIALNSVPKTGHKLLKYSFFNFSFSFSRFTSWLSSISKYLHACLGSSSLLSPQMCLLYVFCPGLYLFYTNSWGLLWTLLFITQIFEQFSNPKFILMSLLIGFTIFISFSKLSSVLPGSFKSSIYSKWFCSSQFCVLNIHNQLSSARVLMD